MHTKKIQKNGIRLLCLTEPSFSTEYEDTYHLLKAFRALPHCREVAVASLESPSNNAFAKYGTDKVTAVVVDDAFPFTTTANAFETLPRREFHFLDFDVIFLRLETGLKRYRLLDLKERFPKGIIIDDPHWSTYYDNKKHLLELRRALNEPSWMPRMDVIETPDAFDRLSRQYGEFILKPIESSGGRGIIRVERDEEGMSIVRNGSERFQLEEYREHIYELIRSSDGYMMQELLDIEQGDNRIIVVCGEIVGSFVRTARQGSYLANVAQGGNVKALKNIRQEEYEMVHSLFPLLHEKNIIFFGIDTIADFEENRKLTEINVTNIGGLVLAERMTGEAVVEKTAHLIWNYILHQAEMLQ